MKRFFILLLISVFLPLQAYGQQNWTKIGNNVNNAFFFVVDKIIALQDFFIGQALSIGRIVLLIAILSAALNYALTGNGLKENIVKILKATLFFLIVIAAYPRIIGFITNWTSDMAMKSIYPSVNAYFSGIGDTRNYDYVDYTPAGRTHIQTTVTELLRQDNSHLFGNLTTSRNAVARKNPRYEIEYTSVSPAAVFKIIFFLASDCFSYADDKGNRSLFPDFKRILIGLLCAFVIIFTVADRPIFLLKLYYIFFLLVINYCCRSTNFLVKLY